MQTLASNLHNVYDVTLGYILATELNMAESDLEDLVLTQK